MLKLLLPILVPSWRFFSSIGPSPRIEWACVQQTSEQPQQWQALRPLPARLSWWQGVLCLVWNPLWNETLYINTCAEHLFAGYSPMREREIMQRLLAMVNRGELAVDKRAQYLLFRISASMREQQEIVCKVVFISQPMALAGVAQ